MQATVKHGRGHVMVWDCMSAQEMGELVFVDEIMGKNLSYKFKKQSEEERGKYGDSRFCLSVCLSVVMRTHCTITCFGFRARRIAGVKCGLFSNNAPLGRPHYVWD